MLYLQIYGFVICRQSDTLESWSEVVSSTSKDFGLTVQSRSRASVSQQVSKNLKVKLLVSDDVKRMILLFDA